MTVLLTALTSMHVLLKYHTLKVNFNIHFNHLTACCEVINKLTLILSQ